MDLLDIITSILTEKQQQKRRPLVASFKEIYDHQTDSWATMYDKLLKLEQKGEIHIGNTINGKYATLPIYHSINQKYYEHIKAAGSSLSDCRDMHLGVDTQ